ncbi:MAG: hypothetical protein ACRDCB_11305 [Clostridium sp.]|uniref:hypothetical protein n=1 Tax=Clostridium TaxID=1485 RepID=UPI002152736E|nr:hypothetical protein [Clostridium sp. LY3-2]MCR6513630.1 hypothetical protein [Clostridium sp. LY3-2]
MKRCVYCDREITYEYLEKQKNKEEIRCPICYKKLKVNEISRLEFVSIVSLISILLLLLPLKILSRIIVVSLFIYLSFKYLKVRIYKYEEIKK